MKLLKGKVVADQVKDTLKVEVEKLKANGKGVHLAIIQVGNDDASSVYVKNKIKACEYVGIDSTVIRLSSHISEEALLDTIRKLNEDEVIDGILVQLPLPAHINESLVLSTISPEKDVDGFHAINAGNLMIGNDSIVPCTPAGIMMLLSYYNIAVSGKECVVVGRSNIVGKPMAMLMLHNNATVTICHSKTESLKDVCKRADILVCAIGKPKFFTSEYVKCGATVIDVGIHRQADGTLCGDVDFESVDGRAAAVTPVPGGVGVMTVAMLMYNCLKIAARRCGLESNNEN